MEGSNDVMGMEGWNGRMEWKMEWKDGMEGWNGRMAHVHTAYTPTSKCIYYYTGRNTPLILLLVV